MKLLPLTLAAYKGNWQRFISRKRNKRFLEIQKKVFSRDKKTCHYCGFISNKYQVVVNRDHNYRNNKAANLSTACMFCAQCFFLDAVGKNNHTGGHIIYLPEVSQADLNHFCRVLFSSMLNDAPYRGKLNATYLSFYDRSKTVDEVFGPGSSEPSTFGQTLIDSNLSKKDLNSELMLSLRLLPTKKPFSQEIVYWKNNIFDQIPL